MRFGRRRSDRAERGNVRGALSSEPRNSPWLRGAAACVLISVAVVLAAWSSASTPSQAVSLAASAAGRSSTSTPSLAVPTTLGSTSTSVSAPTTSTSTPSVASTTVGVAATAVSRADVCTAATTYVDRLRRLSISLTDPQKTRSLVPGVSATSREVAGAPAEVRTELAGVAAAIDAAKGDLEEAGYAPDKLRPEVLTRLTGPEVVMGISRIEAWAKTGC